MSANQGRLRSAIQRIAREDPEIRQTIDGFKDRGGFDSVSTQIAGADDDRGICCDGSSSGNRNPGSDTRDPSENAKDGLDPDDPADISDNLTGVVDCETGQPICWEGGDWIPPEGWEDARTPPIDPTWQEGFFWAVGSQLSYKALTALGSCLAASGGSGSNIRAVMISSGCARCDREVWIDDGPDDGYWLTQAFAITCPRECSGDIICDAPPPVVSDWPANGCADVAIIDGAIVGSKRDPENDGSYSSPKSEIELCDPETGDSILIRPSAGSGWKSIQSLQGEPDGAVDNGYLYTHDGRRIRQISPSEFRDDTV